MATSDDPLRRPAAPRRTSELATDPLAWAPPHDLRAVRVLSPSRRPRADERNGERPSENAQRARKLSCVRRRWSGNSGARGSATRGVRPGWRSSGCGRVAGGVAAPGSHRTGYVEFHITGSEGGPASQGAGPTRLKRSRLRCGCFDGQPTVRPPAVAPTRVGEGTSGGSRPHRRGLRAVETSASGRAVEVPEWKQGVAPPERRQ